MITLTPNTNSTATAARVLSNTIQALRRTRSASFRRAEYRRWFEALRSPDYRLALHTACTGLDPVLDQMIEPAPRLRLAA